MHKIPMRLAGIIVIGFIMSLCSACGKKAPPEPPERTRLPAVAGLNLRLVDSRVILSWATENVEEKAFRNLSGFHVLRARREPPPIGCENCPLSYERVGDVVYRNGDAPREGWYFEDDPVGGFIYFYKVRGYSEKGATGPESEIVSVDLSK